MSGSFPSMLMVDRRAAPEAVRLVVLHWRDARGAHCPLERRHDR